MILSGEYLLTTGNHPRIPLEKLANQNQIRSRVLRSKRSIHNSAQQCKLDLTVQSFCRLHFNVSCVLRLLLFCKLSDSLLLNGLFLAVLI